MDRPRLFSVSAPVLSCFSLSLSFSLSLFEFPCYRDNVNMNNSARLRSVAFIFGALSFSRDRGDPVIPHPFDGFDVLLE